MITVEVRRVEQLPVRYLKVEAGVRYWEDATVNGIEDESGELIPCRSGDTWAPIIDLENGSIEGWPANTIAKIHYKVCDAGRYALLNAERKEVKAIDGYVPAIMCPDGGGYGDYIVMTIGPDGAIANFDGSNLEAFDDA